MTNDTLEYRLRDRLEKNRFWHANCQALIAGVTPPPQPLFESAMTYFAIVSELELILRETR